MLISNLPLFKPEPPAAEVPHDTCKGGEFLPTQDDALSDLKKEGYNNDFDTDPVSLYGGDLDLRLNPDAYCVDGKFEVDEPDRPGETEEVFAITYATGVKGFVVDEEAPCPRATRPTICGVS